MALSGWRLRTQNIHLRLWECWYHTLEAPASFETGGRQGDEWRQGTDKGAMEPLINAGWMTPRQGCWCCRSPTPINRIKGARIDKKVQKFSKAQIRVKDSNLWHQWRENTSLLVRQCQCNVPKSDQGESTLEGTIKLSVCSSRSMCIRGPPTPQHVILPDRSQD